MSDSGSTLNLSASTTPPITFKALHEYALPVLKRNLLVVAIITLLYVILSQYSQELIQYLIGDTPHQYENPGPKPLLFPNDKPIAESISITLIAISIGFLIHSFFLALIGLVNQADQNQEDVGSLFSLGITGLKKTFPIFLAEFLKSFILVIGTLLFILPGIYCFLRLFLMEYIVLFEQKSTFHALKESWKRMKGKLLLLSGFLGLFITVMMIINLIFLYAIPSGLSYFTTLTIDQHTEKLLLFIASYIGAWISVYFYSLAYYLRWATQSEFSSLPDK